MGDRLLFPGYPLGAIDRGTECKEKSLTRQSDAESADINVIMRRAEKTGVLPLETREAVFTDVSHIGSYRDALEIMQQAQEGFLALSPEIRAKFMNDPVSFLDFASREENRAELEKLGVLAAPPQEKVVEAKPAEPAVAQ